MWGGNRGHKNFRFGGKDSANLDRSRCHLIRAATTKFWSSPTGEESYMYLYGGIWPEYVRRVLQRTLFAFSPLIARMKQLFTTARQTPKLYASTPRDGSIQELDVYVSVIAVRWTTTIHCRLTVRTPSHVSWPGKLARRLSISGFLVRAVCASDALSPTLPPWLDCVATEKSPVAMNLSVNDELMSVKLKSYRPTPTKAFR